MSPEGIFLYVSAFALGAAVGSFLNVCIYRMPRGQSIILPASRCPKCGSHIGACDNVPILSYIVLAGKCRDCKGRISPRYPAVEALNGALYVVLLGRFGFGWHAPVYFLFASALVVITFIDLDFQIIPDSITLPGAAVGLFAGSLFLPDPFMRTANLGWLNSVLGAAAGFSLYYLIAEASFRVFKQQGMGGGDIKMMAMAGAFLGWKGVLLTTMAGSLTGSLAGLLLMATGKKGRRALIPFGPFLALGALITLFFGQEILRWYLHERY